MLLRERQKHLGQFNVSRVFFCFPYRFHFLSLASPLCGKSSVWQAGDGNHDAGVLGDIIGVGSLLPAPRIPTDLRIAYAQTCFPPLEFANRHLVRRRFARRNCRRIDQRGFRGIVHFGRREDS